ncbi:hypothetical protein CXB51_000747 [Gossypium anomalum]|uniref:Aminotransferase-like plant mobile domain-containing protein n=1 Tax=Gossypium anomalum TaxID=47600 RepID=A0A8J5ZRI3_9ROSI|nr:hypothetical protein CXB51_000747 [Gossypium anomalum]
MASFITETNHTSDMINVAGSYRILRCCVNSVGYLSDPRLMPYLDAFGFRSTAMIRTFDLKYDLISNLVERWHPETHTFHLLCRECTITLEDVALRLRLPIDGSAITGVSIVSEPTALFYDLIGRSLVGGGDKFTSLIFSWLKANFEYLFSTATEQEVMCVARAYIMHTIGGVHMPNPNNKVHLMYLSLLSDLYAARSYCWGSAVLATLYRKLFQTTKHYAVDIGRCLVLL